VLDEFTMGPEHDEASWGGEQPYPYERAAIAVHGALGGSLP
jgi:hypothetical protein